METLVERRQFRRFDCSFRVRYATNDGIASIQSYTVAKNISRGGLRLLVSRLIKKGDVLRLKIFREDEKKPIETLAKVKWVNEELVPSSLIVDAGVQFTEIDPYSVDQLLSTVR